MTAIIRYQDSHIFADIRLSERVNPNEVIIDSRLFDELGCTESCNVEISSLEEDIPECSELTMLVDSLEDIENRKVVEAVSKRMEDFKVHLDGLILNVGQKVSIPQLKLQIVVNDINPKAPVAQASRIVWKYLLKVNLIAMMEQQCCNVCFAIDIGAASFKKDLDGAQEAQKHERIDAVRTLLKQVESSNVCKDSLIAMVAYAESAIKIEYEGTEAFAPDSDFSQFFDEILSTSGEDHSRDPSNPGSALELALESCKYLTSMNGLPTAIVLASGGVYSAGRNPVSIARRLASEEEISIMCLAIGKNADLEIMQAIADAGGGRLIHIAQLGDVTMVTNQIFDWNRIEAGSN